MPRYAPSDHLTGPRSVEHLEGLGFSATQTFARLDYVRELDGVDAAIIGVPFDTGITVRTGAQFGPGAVRKMSQATRTYNPSLDVDVYDHLSVVDYGDLPVVPGYLEDTYKRIVEGLQPLLAAGVLPIIIGGDHSITLPVLRALTQRHGPVGFLQFDSHVDTWDQYFGREYVYHTPLRQAVDECLIDTTRTIQIGMRGSLYGPDDLPQWRERGFEVWTTDDVRREGFAASLAAIQRCLGDGPVFLTFDIDFIDPSFAPGTGTPEIGGFTSREAQEFLRGLVGLNLVGMDLVEVLPAYDPAGITALIGANVIFEFLSVLAINQRNGQHDPEVRRGRTQ